MKNTTVLESLILPKLESLPVFRDLTGNIGAVSKALEKKYTIPFLQTERMIGQAFEATRFVASVGESLSALTPCTEIIKRWESTFTLPKSFTESVTAFKQLDGLYSSALSSEVNMLAKLPGSIIKFSTEELILSRRCLEVFAEPEPEPLPIELPSENLLQSYDESLWLMLEGAQTALAIKQADYKRHVLTSLRELCSHLLRELTPDEQLMPWVLEQSSSDGLLHEDRPTRRARWLYVCREFDNKFIGDFVAHDAKALRILFETLNRVHEKTPSISDSELEILIMRTRHFLEYILTVVKGG